MRTRNFWIFSLIWLISTLRAVSTFEFPEQYSCRRLAELANVCISMGEPEAIRALSEYWVEVNQDEYRWQEALKARTWIGSLARILYDTDRLHHPLREPWFGAFGLPRESMPPEDWPVFPLAEAEGVYFVLRYRYSLRGLSEDPIDYLHYCAEHADFRTEPLIVPTKEQAHAALDALVRTEAWERLREIQSTKVWPDLPGWSLELQDYLREQADRP